MAGRTGHPMACPYQALAATRVSARRCPELGRLGRAVPPSSFVTVRS
jgi:hypothetical protein